MSVTNTGDGLRIFRVSQVALQDVNMNFVGIPPTIGLEFHISRGLQSSVNEATFKLYNLGPATRANLYKDQSTTDGSPATRRQISFWAGYNDTWFNDYLTQYGGSPTPPIVPPPPGCALCFTGYLDYVRSYRDGPNWVTEIHAIDGGAAVMSAITGETYPAGTTEKTILQRLIDDFNALNPRVTIQAGGQGQAGQFAYSPGADALLSSTKRTRSVTMTSSSWKQMLTLIRQYPSLAITCDLNEIRVATYADSFNDGSLVIDDTVGIIGIPWTTSTRMQINLLLFTGVRLWSKVTVNTVLAYGNNANINGDHKVLAIEHYGTINPSEGGEARTVLTLQLGATAVPQSTS